MFDPLKLRHVLSEAAARAGYQGWWLADDLIAGISGFLLSEHADGLSKHRDPEELIRFVLRTVGYQEIAMQLQSNTSFYSLSLLECLHKRIPHDRAAFFGALAERIEHMHGTKARYVRFHDLRACAQELQCAWPPARMPDGECQSQSVVAFIRECVQTRWQSQSVWCSIM